jgi:hypothetical protein
MALPGGLAYGQAVQHPAVAFGDDPILGSSSPMPGLFGQPKAFSGNFALVFQLRGDDGRLWAAKCFTRDVPNRDERYGAIHKLLHEIERPWEVEFDYLPAGVLVDGVRHPLVRMEWIDAVTLGTFLRDEDVMTEDVERASEGFRTVVDSLYEDGIAHGDLQHGNVLVDRSGGIRLVDYDGMFVPAISHLGAAELGHPSYQSPHRDRTHFGPHIDHHSAWVIHAALRARALDPQLFHELDIEDDGLLFGATDLTDPFTARVVERFSSAGGELRALAHDLVEVLGKPPSSVPALEPPDPGLAIGETCRPTGTCQLCDADLCRLCDRGAVQCHACAVPERVPWLDTATTVAWRLGSEAVIQVGRRVARLVAADGGERLWVPPDDVNRTARGAVRCYASVNGLPLDVGAVLRRAPKPQVDGPYEWLRHELADTEVVYDPTAATAKVMAQAVNYLEVDDVDALEVRSESGSPVGELVAKLRRRAKPPSPGQLVVDVEEEWTRIRLVPEGLWWQRERRSPDGAVLILDTGLERWSIDATEGANGPKIVAEYADVRAEIERVHRSLLVTVADDEDRRAWFAPYDASASELIETTLSRHPLVTAGGIITSHGVPGASPPPAAPTGAELVGRSRRTVLKPTESGDPRLSDHLERPLMIDDLARLGVRADVRTSTSEERLRFGRSMSAGLLAIADRLLPAPVVHPHLPAVEVVETWQSEGQATVRYVAEIDRPVGPPDEAGRTLTDFIVLADGELAPLTAARACNGCSAVLPEEEMFGCEGCGRPARCRDCAPPTTPAIGHECVDCGTRICSACDPEERSTCAICLGRLCRECGAPQLCRRCDPSTWRPWTDPLPRQLQANRLRVLGRRDGAVLRVYLEGHRRREFAIVEGEDVRAWSCTDPRSVESIRLARRWKGVSDLLLVTTAPDMETVEAAGEGLTVSRESSYLVRWRLRSGFAEGGGRIALEGPPASPHLEGDRRVREHFELSAMGTDGSSSDEVSDEAVPRVVALPNAIARRFAVIAERLPVPPNDVIELSLETVVHDLLLTAGGFTIGKRHAAGWELQEAVLAPWSSGLAVPHLVVRCGPWHATLLRLRTTVVLTLTDGLGETDSWLITGDRNELLRLRHGVRWLRQAALANVTAQFSPQDLMERGFVLQQILIQDPSGTAWEVPGQEPAALSMVVADLSPGVLPERLCADLASVAYARLKTLPDIPLRLGVRGDLGGAKVDLWPPGVTPPKRWLSLPSTTSTLPPPPPPPGAPGPAGVASPVGARG